MGGNKATYASTRAAHTRDHDHDHDNVHSIRKSQPTRLPSNQQFDASDDDASGDGVSASVAKLTPFRTHDDQSGHYSDANDADDDDEDDDDDDFYEEQEREREVLREREEMKQRFTFQEHRRRNLKTNIMSAMRRKRRMLLRNENLRFRELYKPPEPGVVIAVVAMVTIVSLILTKSWPFY